RRGSAWFPPRRNRRFTSRSKAELKRRGSNVRLRSTFAFVGVAAMLGGCATVPTGPAVTVMPGTGKTFEAFQQDQAACQQYAQAAIGGQYAGQPANDRPGRTGPAGGAVGRG